MISLIKAWLYKHQLIKQIVVEIREPKNGVAK